MKPLKTEPTPEQRVAELEDALRRINGHLSSCVDAVTTADVHLVKGMIRNALSNSTGERNP